MGRPLHCLSSVIPRTYGLTQQIPQLMAEHRTFVGCAKCAAPLEHEDHTSLHNTLYLTLSGSRIHFSGSNRLGHMYEVRETRYSYIYQGSFSMIASCAVESTHVGSSAECNKWLVGKKTKTATMGGEGGGGRERSANSRSATLLSSQIPWIGHVQDTHIFRVCKAQFFECMIRLVRGQIHAK